MSHKVKQEVKTVSTAGYACDVDGCDNWSQDYSGVVRITRCIKLDGVLDALERHACNACAYKLVGLDQYANS